MANERLQARDYAVLMALTAAFYACFLLISRPLNPHETVHCQNVREMFSSAEWLIPTYGGRPWLERPPLPHWCTGICTFLGGGLEHAQAFRIGSIVAGTLGVLMAAWIASVFFGRRIGLLTGAVLATTREYVAYAIGPECDIFLAVLILAVHTLFVRVEFAGAVGANVDDRRFLGRRPWPVLALFALAGLTNIAKGPLFGTFFIVVPLLAYFAWNADWQGLRRYLWLWGWLAYLVVGLAWPVTAWLRYPDIVDLWTNDYGHRWNQGFVGEPWWYYLCQLPWAVAPWTVLVALGLWQSRKTAAEGSPRHVSYLFCWGAVPIVVLSLFQGKHHHYLLPCLTPWAALGAVGALHAWQWLRAARPWIRSPIACAAVLGGLVDLALIVLWNRIPISQGLKPVLLAAAPLVIFLVWAAAGSRDARLAVGGVIAAFAGLHLLVFACYATVLNRFEDDLAFLRQARTIVPTDRPLFVENDVHPLNSSWLLFYLGDRGTLLHNLTFLRDDRIRESEVYVIARAANEPVLAGFGVVRPLLQSRKTRGEATPADRWTLYHIRFHADLGRISGNVRINPLQATGRAPGPFLQ